MSSGRTGRRIAILGCGYVGSALGKALVDRGDHVIGTTTTPSRTEEISALGIVPEVIQLSEGKRLRQLLLDRDMVYCTVAASSRCPDYRQIYLDGAKCLLWAVEGTAVRGIIYTSSTRVYGQQDGSWVDETSPTEPLDENGRILREAERTFLETSTVLSTPQSLAVTVVRLSGIYGPGRDPTVRILRFSGQERYDGDGYVNLIHRDDIVLALLGLLDLRHHGVFVLSDDRPTKRRVYYDRVIAEAGLPSIRWLNKDSPPKLGKRVRNDLIKRTLDLVLKYPTH